MPRLGSLFSGLAGLDMGLAQAGIGEVIWYAEIDAFCSKLLAQHYPDVPNVGDVRNAVGASLADVICSGFPCQPSSVAGQRRGTADDRWLWPVTLKAIEAHRPSYVVLENVPGLLTVNGGAAFGEVLAGFAQAEYDAAWIHVRAADVGAPHRRERVFVVGWRRDATPLGLEPRAPEPHAWPPGPGDRERWGAWLAAGGPPPAVPRGVAQRVARLRALGNAVVPQVGAAVGRFVCHLDRAISGSIVTVECSGRPLEDWLCKTALAALHAGAYVGDLAGVELRTKQVALPWAAAEQARWPRAGALGFASEPPVMDNFWCSPDRFEAAL